MKPIGEFTVTSRLSGMTVTVFEGEWSGDEPLRTICELAMSNENLFPRFDYIPDRDRNAAFVIAEWLGGEFGPENVPVENVVPGRVY